MPRLWIFSDLHQEWPENDWDPTAHAPQDGFDVAVVPGDIHTPLTSAIDWLADRLLGVPVVFVPGNHDTASRAFALSSIAAGALGRSFDGEEAFGAVWQLRDDGSVARHGLDVETPAIFDRGKWKVVLPRSVENLMAQMRAVKLPAETGGVLFGIVDISARRIDLVDAWPPPVGSKGSQTEFERGVGGLKDDVIKAMAMTLDQIRYVGEWHSHPKGASTAPSETDIGQIGWLAETMSSDECPGLMLIVGDQGVDASLGNVKPALAIEQEVSPEPGSAG
ncbi:hypothetical protein GJ654_11345 [Rhodoblastus acidophilus]|uniref:JAB domain-containing protein n=1 Tax=Rhodoblastus acidophilus TaxID=1074 RepID=A0A6N8DMN3_RHOAC|nr:Mov34/MPN/PAD-1 family protein [Rhodoblastus acidophilus]MCW2276539.1 proteasome lid subunit RPN8/RPN11 [Rhodoblastus acidophilus]MTV31588.1 hypothetical protein [Rhodoblastus acidophilus]